jgi:hypothetical protein
LLAFKDKETISNMLSYHWKCILRKWICGQLMLRKEMTICKDYITNCILRLQNKLEVFFTHVHYSSYTDTTLCTPHETPLVIL